MTRRKTTLRDAISWSRYATPRARCDAARCPVCICTCVYVRMCVHMCVHSCLRLTHWNHKREISLLSAVGHFLQPYFVLLRQNVKLVLGQNIISYGSKYLSYSIFILGQNTLPIDRELRFIRLRIKAKGYRAKGCALENGAYFYYYYYY